MSGSGVVVMDDGRLNRECLTGQLRSHRVKTREAWDLPSLVGQVDTDTPELILRVSPLSWWGLGSEVDRSGDASGVSLQAVGWAIA